MNSLLDEWAIDEQAIDELFAELDEKGERAFH